MRKNTPSNGRGAAAVGRREVLVMACAAALCLAAAGQAFAEAKKVKLGFVYWDNATDAFVQMANGGKAVEGADGQVEVQLAAPDRGDPQKQAALFGPIAQTQKDGIVLQTLFAAPLTRLVADAVHSGVPVVAIDAPPPDGAGVGLFITADNIGIGAQLAQKVLALVPVGAKGSVLIGNEGVGIPPLDMRVKGMIKAIGELRPDLKVVGPVSTFGVSGASSEVYSAWEALLRANSDAVAVLSPSAADATAWGLLAKRAGFKLPAGGFDLEAGNLQAVKDGSVAYLMSPNHFLSGYLATRALADSALGKRKLPQGLMLVPGELVSAENIDAIIARQAGVKSVAAALAPVGDDILANADKHIVGPWPPK